MKKLLLAIPLVALVAGCETQQQRMITGAATGAAIGAAINDDDRAKGAALGGAAGLAAGALIGPSNQQGKCRYRNSAGQEYIAAC